MAPWHNITKQGFEAIDGGMTRGEVEAILGRAPGYYGCDETDWIWGFGWDHFIWLGPDRVGEKFSQWHTMEIGISVGFSPDGRVANKMMRGPRIFRSDGVLTRFRRWVGL